MIRQLMLAVLSLLLSIASMAQQAAPSVHEYLDVSLTAGESRGAVAASYAHNWRIGKSGKWELGLGGRITSSFGTKQAYTTAPARLSRSSTIPLLVVVAGQKTENWDTLTVQRPWITAINLTANAAFNFSNRWQAGLNIDLIGVAFGRRSAAILLSNGLTRTEQAAVPASFNLLLTGDLDYGNLNSEFFVHRRLSNKWGVRAVYQFLFNEYTTSQIFQAAPDGTIVKRFRQKANNLGVAFTYHF